MSQELRKKAVEMLLAGATLVAEPCPYCGGVRVIKDGNALCISCGKEPDKTKIEETPTQKQGQMQNPVLESLNKKLEQLTAELESEKDLEKQQQILKSINSLIETIQKLKK
ncbi:MAG: Sjogren's syndrome/scleroderma autoantigen 1 family protein [Candidatus Nitrosotenuis sp.]